MSLVVGFSGLNPDWPPTSMRSFLLPRSLRVLLTGKMQRENLGAVLAGRGRCLLKYHQQALWADTERECDGGGGRICAGQGIDRRKHTRSKRQEAINESTQYTGFIRRL